ncbi:pentatricopeptide repeat-containing protein [Populus alba x Populus x berolinensis]|uniref:Pentatricopeptide repeat-containing protein n=1 Tax=Populus alba x Populus x berolinensis TaxID=444605 RepID=A0AAD6Q7F6_9ROSI|nr:pentatricopeptide repeat-containing protein [Populus alba x Populus x berolinensis]
MLSFASQRKMQPKLQMHKLYRKSLSHNPLLAKYVLPKLLCTLTELTLACDSPNSPQPRPSILSTWLCNDQKPKVGKPTNGHFVIPSHANCDKYPNIESHKNIASLSLLSEASDSDVHKVGEILKKQYSSENAVVEALNESGISATHDLVSQLLKRFSNQWLMALGVFIWAKNQTGYVHKPEIYNSMIDILGKSRKFSLMWDLVQEMSGLNGYVSLVTMGKVMKRLVRDGKYNEAIDAFRGLEKFGLSKSTEAMNVLMDILARNGRVEDARAVALEFEDCLTLDYRSYNILSSGYCKARMFNDARKTMEEMEERGFHPNVVSYTAFIEAYGEQKDFRNVEIILNEMQEKGCPPDLITYTVYIRALGKARQINKALEVCEEIKRNGFVLGTQFYCSLIHSLCLSGRLKDAWNIFEDVEKQGVGRDLGMYKAMISAACALSQDESALKLLHKMEEDSCKPDVQIYAPLLKKCCRKKNMKMLKFLLNHMFENDVSIDIVTYDLLVHGLRKQGKLKYACFFFQEAVLKGMVPCDKTYKILLEELERKNMAEMKGKIEKLMLRAKELNRI